MFDSTDKDLPGDLGATNCLPPLFRMPTHLPDAASPSKEEFEEALEVAGTDGKGVGHRHQWGSQNDRLFGRRPFKERGEGEARGGR